MGDEPLWPMRPLSRQERVTLARIEKMPMRYATRYGICAQLRNLGLVLAHDTGKPPPGQWVWRITAAGRDWLRGIVRERRDG